MLQRFRRPGVDDIPNIGFVDAHAERDRGDDDSRAVVDEVVLIPAARVVVEAGVIRQGGKSGFREAGSEAIDVGSADAIDNAGIRRVAVDHFADLAKEIGAAGHAIDQVRPVERANEDFGLGEAELAGDVVADSLGGGGGVGVDADGGKYVLERFEHAIFGAEIVPPVADAVGFVDGEEREGRFAEELERALGHELFGRQVELLQAAGAYFFGDAALVVNVNRAVDAGGGDAVVGEGIDLVFH